MTRAALLLALALTGCRATTVPCVAGDPDPRHGCDVAHHDARDGIHLANNTGEQQWSAAWQAAVP